MFQGLGWNPVPFDVSLLCSSLSLSLSHSLPFGSRGRRGRRGTNALEKGRRKWSPLLQKMTVNLKTKARKKNILPCQILLLSSVQNHWSNWGGMGVTGEFGPPNYQIDICLPGLNIAPLSLLDKFYVSIKLI